MSVSGVLFRLYRPLVLWFAGAMLTVELIFIGTLVTLGEPRFSPWLVVVVPASKYWLLVVGIMLVTVNLRQVVANGATRREFLAGAAVFGLVAALGFALAVVLGHGLESVLLGAAGERGDGYPVASAGVLAAEFGQVLPITLAYPVAGGLIASGFYRWRVRTALAMMVLAAVPIAVADGLLGLDEFGERADRLPYVLALSLSLIVTAAGVLAFRRVVRDVAIKRATG